MNVVIFGLGYVGCTAAGCIASQGHRVLGIDVSEGKVAAIAQGRSPVSEPDLDRLVAEAHAAGRLSASTAIGGALDDADVAIVCVGTPSGVDGAHEMGFVAQVSRDIAAALDPDRAAPLTVAYRSTMRPGTTEQLIAPIFAHALGADWQGAATLVYNPEFLREGTAIADYFAPPKIVIGTLDGAPCPAMDALHDGIDAPVFAVGIREAELTKFVDNSWHAVKVGFANEIGRVCENMGISARAVHEIFVADTKLNISSYYTRPGGPFGGSCLPKDVRALQRIAADTGSATHLVDSLIRTNDAHKHHQFRRATEGLAPGARILLVGLAFKADTDDLRESPAVDLARMLLDEGYRVEIYDPLVKPAALVGANLGYAVAQLPSFASLLVDRATAERGGHDRVIATNRLWRDLDLAGANVLDLSSIS